MDIIPINNSDYSHYSKDLFKIGISSCNDFIPVYNINKYQDEYVNDVSGFMFKTYHKLNKESNSSRGAYKHNTFIARLLEKRDSLSKYYLKNSKGEITNIYVNSWYIVNEENEFLLLLSLKKKYCSEKDSWVDNNSSQLRITDTNSEHFVLFLSTELFNNPNYTVFYKKLQKEFIDTFHKIGVEVRIIPSSKIEEANYSNNFNMNFNKIDELTNHLNNDVQHLLFNNRNYAVSAGLNVPLEDRNPIFVPEEPVQESDLDWIDEYIGRPTRRRTRPTESGYNIQLIDDTVDTDTLTPF